MTDEDDRWGKRIREVRTEHCPTCGGMRDTTYAGETPDGAQELRRCDDCGSNFSVDGWVTSKHSEATRFD